MTISRRQILGLIGAVGVSKMAFAASAISDKPSSRFQLSQAERFTAHERLLGYLRRTGPMLLRQPAGNLRYPTISPSLPGATYSSELWDWDTYWCALGLFRLARTLGDSTLHEKIGIHSRGSLQTFFEYQSDEGRLPIMISVDREDVFHSLSGGMHRANNQAKPVMAQIALLTSDELRDASWFGPLFDKLLRFYESWTSNNQSHIGLLVWGDDVAIGDDNDPTTFGRPDFSSANLLLNCLYYQDLRAAAELARRLGRNGDHKRLSGQADELGKNIQTYCWDPRDRFYYTVDVQCRDRRAELIPGAALGMSMSWKCLPLRIQMFTGFLPLWCGLATGQQAADVVQLHYLADDRFRANFGVRSLSSHESMYSLAMSMNPSNMLGPIWIVVNYVVWKALKNYGYDDAASELGDKTLQLLASDIEQNGAMDEYYDPDTGAALSSHGFMDWNLLVLNML